VQVLRRAAAVRAAAVSPRSTSHACGHIVARRPVPVGTSQRQSHACGHIAARRHADGAAGVHGLVGERIGVAVGFAAHVRDVPRVKLRQQLLHHDVAELRERGVQRTPAPEHLVDHKLGVAAHADSPPAARQREPQPQDEPLVLRTVVRRRAEVRAAGAQLLVRCGAIHDRSTASRPGVASCPAIKVLHGAQRLTVLRDGLQKFDVASIVGSSGAAVNAVGRACAGKLHQVNARVVYGRTTTVSVAVLELDVG
jgi:hypothetical protein